MKKTISIITLGVAIATIGCSTSNADNSTETVTPTTEIQQEKIINKDVDVVEFKKLISSNEGQILDVRTPEEWNQGIIEGATKMNYYDNDFKKQLAKLDENKPVYVYCKSGGRSGNAAKQMQRMGFKTVYNLLGGITAWNTAGKETVK